jgi:heptosyltransferase II
MPLILLIIKINIKIKISKVYKLIMKILVIQNRMGIGDTVIFLPYIQKISEKFNTPIYLLVKKSSKADQFLCHTEYINKIIFLDRDSKKVGRHDGVMGSLRLVQDLKKFKFNKVFIFNSSLRYNIITRLSGIKEIYQYPLFKKQNQLINKPAIDLIKKKLNLDVNNNPKIEIDRNLEKLAIAKYDIDKNKLNILLAIGGSGPTKRIPTNTFLSVIKKINNIKDCKFFLATGKNENEQIILNQIMSSEFKEKCIPLDNLTIAETLPVIKNCNVSICNDTSFSHLSSALGIKTITLMADTPLIYGSYSSNMYPILPDGEISVGHNTLGKDKINPDKIYNKLISIIS